jgi:hypothetical protein
MGDYAVECGVVLLHGNDDAGCREKAGDGDAWGGCDEYVGGDFGIGVYECGSCYEGGGGGDGEFGECECGWEDYIDRDRDGDRVGGEC